MRAIRWFDDMTLRAQIRRLMKQANEKQKVDLATELLAARKRHQQGVHEPPPTQAQLDKWAKTKLGRALIAARRRAALIPKGTP